VVCALCCCVWQYIGGGVLGHGCVQEEILFAVCGECVASLLFCEVMEENESLLILGAERFCAYTGYRLSFRFAGPWQATEQMGTDDLGRPRGLRAILAIDAVPFGKRIAQWTERMMARELLKAYAGFSVPTDVLTPTTASAASLRSGHAPYSVLSTGNWGCGAFNGDVPLKAFIQLIAAALSGRAMRSVAPP
jgi:poly(ADP-ribose) glycohydrolase